MAAPDDDDVASNVTFRRRQFGLSVLRRTVKTCLFLLLFGIIEYLTYSTMSFIDMQYPLYLAQLEQSMSPPPPPEDMFHCFSCEKINAHSSSSILLHTCSQCNSSSLSQSLPIPLSSQALFHLTRLTKSRLIGTYIDTTFLATDEAQHLDVEERASPYFPLQLFLSFLLDVGTIQLHPAIAACWLILAISIMGQLAIAIVATRICHAELIALNADILADQVNRAEAKRLAKEQLETAQHIERCKLQHAQTFTDNIFGAQMIEPFDTPPAFGLITHEEGVQQQPGTPFGLRCRV